MDAIFLAISGQSQGPYTQAQVREMLARGEIAPDILGWYQGLAGWTAIGQLLDGPASKPSTPAAPFIPLTSPGLTSTPGAFTNDELRTIAKNQNLLMWAVLAGLAAYFLVHIPFLGLPLVLGIVAFEIYSLYMLGTAMRLPLVWLMCAAMFVPCVSIIILVIVSARASRILKAAGVRVGIMGGNAADIKD